MEVTAFCITLLMNALMLLVAHIQHGYSQTLVSDAAFRIVPTRLQLFEYESVHFTCEGFNVSAGCRVRTIKELIPKCSNDTVTSTVTCSIDFAFPSDSGEYWCEAGGGKRSNTVNITVTAGSVILESPALPVMEGEAVTLSCRTKLTSFSSLITHFYKDGRLIGSSPTGNLTIESVFKSHDGRYKCNISGAGESPESRLAVRAKTASTISQSPNEEPPSVDSDPPHPQSPNNRPRAFILLWITLMVLMVALVLVVVGFLHMRRSKASSKTTAAASHSVCGEDAEDDPDGVTYAVVVTKPKQH
ncbi:low affinity immunoglobulin gamma Fc region receptor II-a-like [Sander vitreus]